MVEAFRPRQPEMPRGKEVELPESKIFDLLSSVGNGEHHALDLIVMRGGVVYSGKALDKEMINRQGENPGWIMGWDAPFSHCRQSLAPTGLVTRQALSTDGTAWGYEITQYGLHSGVPFSGLFLKWSYEHPEFSLYKMWGSTHSHSVKDEQTLDKKRAQETRYNLFWEISTNPSNRIRLLDLANGINESLDHIHSHIINLKRNGVVFYESVERGKSVVYFKRKEEVPIGDLTSFSKDKSLSERAYALVSKRSNEFLSREEIANELIQHSHYKGLNGRSLLRRISNVLSHLEKQGYVAREKFDTNRRSEITISDKQREAIESFVALLDRFKDGDRQTIEEGVRFAHKVANDPKLFSNLMLKAKETSPFANRTDREEMDSMLFSTLQGHPNSTANQILQILEKDYDKTLTSRGVRVNISRLVEEGLIVSEKTKAGNVYRVVRI